MNRITKITKRDIIDLFRNGFEVYELFETKAIRYFYWGRFEEIEFLKRLYDLSSLPSTDSRYKDAEGVIWQHTTNNDDYPFCWVFEDERFGLLNGDDEKFLQFLVEVFHPEVREENSYWRELLQRINEFIKNDGYELFPSGKLSGRDVFGWRHFKAEENVLFIPFSERFSKELKDKKIKLSISKKARNQLFQLIDNSNEIFNETGETGWNYTISTIEKTIQNIKQFYPPKCFDANRNYIETDSMQDFICNNVPNCVFDALELFAQNTTDKDFQAKANALLKNNGINYTFKQGEISASFDIQHKDALITTVQEAGLKELLQGAFTYKDEGELSIAVEKIWDALERLKTYYTDIDKKESVQKIIKNMSMGQSSFEKLFSDEFLVLTKIGNDFRIRHHKTNKIDISDKRHYEYFFNRCYSLIKAATQYLQT